MDKGKHDAIYMRVSTSGQSLESQRPEMEAWAKANGNGVVHYEDKFTGRTMRRPGFEKLERELLAGRISKIVVWRLDRLGRTVRGLVDLFDLCRQRGVDLISLRDGFDLNSPTGRLHANILASIAEYETELRAERIRAGITAAKARGKRWGGSKNGQRLKLKGDQRKAVLDMLQRGEPIARIARVLGVSRPTIYRIQGNQDK